MKPLKIILLLISITFFSCNVNEAPFATVKVKKPLEKKLNFTIFQTNGAPLTVNSSFELDFSEVVVNVKSLNNVVIDSMSYKFTNFSGNTAGVVQNLTLTANNTIISRITSRNIANDVTNNEVFEVSRFRRNIIADILLNTQKANFTIDATTLSDAGSMNFDIEIYVSITAEILQ